MTLVVYGIGSCDSCRKARRWLDGHGISFDWVDLRERPPGAERLERWLAELGSDRLVNRRSTSWRNLDPAERPEPGADEWPDVLGKHPTLIKRPVFESGGEVRVGFDDGVREWLTTS